MSKYYFEEEFKIPLYRGYLIVIISNDTEKLEDRLPGHEFNHVYAHTIFDNHKGFQGFHIILNLDHPKRPITVGTIAHEALHVTDMVMHERGVIADHVNDEPSAYLIDWVTDRVCEVLDKNKVYDKVQPYDA